MTELMEKLYTLVNSTLYLDCPVLSRSMKRHIEIKEISDHKVIIEIEAPFYDLNIWRKEHRVKYTGKSINGFTDYAYWVNKYGAFGTHNKSEHWVNRALDDSCKVIANEFGATLINKLGR